MNTVIKFISLLSGFFLIGLSCMMGWMSSMEAYHPLDPFIDTYTSPKYSVEKFNRVEIGFTELEVLQLMGEPLYSFTDTLTFIKTLHFTGDGKLLPVSRDNTSYEDFAWYSSWVKIYDGRVFEVYKGWSYD